MPVRPLRFAMLLLVPAIWGCDGATPADNAPMKSATYYSRHPQEAAQVAGRCNALNEKMQRSLSLSDYQEWQISNQWVNCQSAISVTEAASMRELMLKQSRDARAKTPAPSGRATPSLNNEQVRAP